MKFIRSTACLATCIAATSILTACGGGSSSSSDTPVINLANVQKVVDTNADIALAVYNDAVSTAEALQLALQNFREDPTQANFDAAKTAWLVAREPYGQSEVFRFRASPIDTLDYDARDEDGPEGAINAWPLGEALIDHVKANNDTDFGDDQVGALTTITAVGTTTADANKNKIDAAYAQSNQGDNIIGNTAIAINAELLSHSEAGDGHDVISGYHAIEFMLWGQDLSNDQSLTNDVRDQAVKTHDAPNLATGGQRPLSELADGYNDSTDPYEDTNESDRRHKFMEVVAAQLVDDLKSVRDGWKAGAPYRTKFTTVANEAQAKQRLAEILTGMGTLSGFELASERINVALDANNQEDEHSCFSDNTHRDIWLNAEGVANAYYGDYAGYDSTLDGILNNEDDTGSKVTGYGIDDYLRDAGLTSLATKMEAALSKSATHYQQIDQKARAGEPFDVQIQKNSEADINEPAQQTILALTAESRVIVEITGALGIDSSDIVQGGDE